MSYLHPSYLGTMLSAVNAYRFKDYRGIARPDTLLNQYLNKHISVLKAEVSRYMVEAYQHNDKLIRKKAFWAQFSLYSLIVEVMVLSGVVLFQTIR